MKIKAYSMTLLCLLAAGAARSGEIAPQGNLGDTSETEAPALLPPRATDFAAAEKDLAPAAREANPQGEASLIETSHPYLLPRLFTLPTAYSLQSYEVRFGGQGNIHSTLANLNTRDIKGSVSIGFGGIM